MSVTPDMGARNTGSASSREPMRIGVKAIFTHYKKGPPARANGSV